VDHGHVIRCGGYLLLKLGIPAIGVISIDGKGLPKSLNEIPIL